MHRLATLVSGQYARLHLAQLDALAHSRTLQIGVHLVLSRTTYTRAGSNAAVDPSPSLSGLDDAALAVALGARLRAQFSAASTARVLAAGRR